MRRLISVVTPCYNEEENVEDVYQRVKNVFATLPGYRYEHVFIDNASTDRTVEIVKGIIAKDNNVRLIVNARNFGHLRSPYYAWMQVHGDAVISMAADLQEPPELIPKFIEAWERGYKIVAAVKEGSKESAVMYLIRKLYYKFIARISETKLVHNFNGFGLFDKKVIDILRSLHDPYPYLRGLVAEIGFDVAEIPYTQSTRRRGISKNNFYVLYDMAMLGITSHSKVPLRIATIAGFLLSLLSLSVSFVYLIMKLLSWEEFAVGMAPILIGLFFFSSIQLLFIGLLGEYIAAIHTQVLNRPLVVEKERINFVGSHESDSVRTDDSR